MAKLYKDYNKEVCDYLDSKYNPIGESILANDIAWDLSIGIDPKVVYQTRCAHALNHKRALEVFVEVRTYMQL